MSWTRNVLLPWAFSYYGFLIMITCLALGLLSTTDEGIEGIEGDHLWR